MKRAREEYEEDDKKRRRIYQKEGDDRFKPL
jgi:hypothetical protein